MNVSHRTPLSLGVMKNFRTGLLALSAAALASCSSNVASRVEKNAALYQSLPVEDRNYVNRGEIKKGMTKEAVFLAWGKPDRTGGGENKKGRYERWTYTTLEPIVNQSIYGGFGYGRFHPFIGRRRGWFYQPGFGTQVDYIPRPAAYVDFRNGRVTDWQRGTGYQNQGLFEE